MVAAVGMSAGPWLWLVGRGARERLVQAEVRQAPSGGAALRRGSCQPMPDAVRRAGEEHPSEEVVVVDGGARASGEPLSRIECPGPTLSPRREREGALVAGGQLEAQC